MYLGRQTDRREQPSGPVNGPRLLVAAVYIGEWLCAIWSVSRTNVCGQTRSVSCPHCSVAHWPQCLRQISVSTELSTDGDNETSCVYVCAQRTHTDLRHIGAVMLCCLRRRLWNWRWRVITTARRQIISQLLHLRPPPLPLLSALTRHTNCATLHLALLHRHRDR